MARTETVCAIRFFIHRQNRIMAKTVSMKKAIKAVKVAYRVSDNEASELVPMFINLKAA